MSASPADSTTDLPLVERRLADFQADVLGGLLELHGKFGPVAGLQDGALRVLFSFDPQYNKQMLSDVQTFNTRFFAIRGPKRSSQRRVTCGLLGMNGEQWKRNRRLVKEPFGLKQIATYRPTIERLADQVAESWTDGQDVDMNQEMVRFMLRVTSTILFGMSDSPEERQLAYDVGEQIAEWGKLNHELGIGALVPDTTFSEGYEKLLAFSEGLEKQVMELITRRRNATQNGAAVGNDVLSILVNTHDEAGGLSDEELVGQSCVLFAAAHLTTAHSITWTLFLLAQHPSVRQALTAELSAAVGQPTPGRPDPNSLLERVIRESMRMLPASSYSQRINTESIDFGPFKDVPRGTPIVFSPFITHRLESIYEQPKRFDPDRWLTIKPSLYEYLPLGAGPRMCIGGPLALEVVRTSLPRFLAGRKMRVQPGADVSAQIRSTMLHPINGVPMTLHTDDGDYQASQLKGNVAGELVDMTEA
ncbi:MAG: cytochrome P450 [Planctomycetota bacterium]